MLNYEYPPLGGGASPVTKYLAEELVCLGHCVDVVTMSYKQLSSEEIVNGVNIYRVPAIRKEQGVCRTHEMLSYCWSAYNFLCKLLKEKEYDINHTHFIIPTGLVSLLLKDKLPYIITSHGSDVPFYNPDRFRFQHRMIKPFWVNIVSNASAITTPSIHLKDLIIKSFDNKIYKKPFRIIPNGILPENFNPQQKEKKILVVTRLFKRKGVQYVIEAMQGIKDYELVICGEGPYRKELEELISGLELDNVHMLGYVDEQKLIHEYETASIFVFPSSSESFGMVLVEAMAAQCAIITSKTSACPEVVGDCALFVELEDPQDIRSNIIKLIEQPQLREDIARKGRERAIEKFTWQSIAKRYEDLYKKTLAGPMDAE